MKYKNGDPVDTDMLVIESTVRMASNGKNFVEMTLVTEDGNRFEKSKIWDSDNAPTGVIHVKGKIDLFNGNFQVIVNSWTKSDEDIDKFYPKCPWKLEFNSLLKLFKTLWESVKTPEISQIIPEFIGYAGICEEDDPKVPFYETQYFRHPGGRMVHHSYVHGLLEHSIEVATHGLNAARVHGLNQREQDLVVVGGLIHDIGKVHEIELKDGSYVLSERAKMYGWNSSAHLYIGHALLTLYAEKPENLASKQDIQILENVILSHHGPYGHVKPASMVAEIVHQADMMSSRINRMKKNLLLSDGDVESDQVRDSYIKIDGIES